MNRSLRLRVCLETTRPLLRGRNRVRVSERSIHCRWSDPMPRTSTTTLEVSVEVRFSLHVYWLVPSTTVLGDVVANVYSFCIVVPNHCGGDMVRFDTPVKAYSADFFLRLVITSVIQQKSVPLIPLLRCFRYWWIRFQHGVAMHVCLDVWVGSTPPHTVRSHTPFTRSDWIIKPI